MPDTYITTQGSVSLQHKDGTSPLYRYGDPVDLSKLSSGQLEHIDAFTGDNPGVKYEQSLSDQIANTQTIDHSADFRAAMADGGQVNSTSSPIPSNYGELDDDEAASFVRVLESNPSSQAIVVAHELRNGNRAGVIDAATKGIKELAKRYVDADGDAVNGPDVHTPGTGVAEPTPVASIPEPSSNPEEAVKAFLAGDAAVASTAAPGVVPATHRTTRSDDNHGDDGDGDVELTGEALDARAKDLDIEGRSGMSADEKRDAIAEAEASQGS